MFSTTLKQQIRQTPAQTTTKLITRGYAGRPQVASALPSRPLKRIRVGKARPAIYHKFNCQVELSDGSVILRQTQFPRDELRMITDQRNNPIWNRSKPDVSLLDAEAKGKLNKFKNKFAAFEQSGKTEEEIEKVKQQEAEERKMRLETGAAASSSKEDAETDDFFDMLSSNYSEEKLGGNLAAKKKGKK
ncbi:unnamed protein product [Ambrosiozyma monospora]|uniref:Unnamed protein product n=1 Tax=Ambrosiozyma monospora TaxID=43982 RepID=A0ACB5U4B0_AMBMO|nr:unnamed protein product [Ambrosiozyma monospora]